MLNLCICGKKVIKQGLLYNEIKNQIRPFDVIFIKGDKIFSTVVSILESLGNKEPQSGEFSHIGMVVTSEIFEHELVKPGKLYLYESVVSGKIDHNIFNIYGQSFAGVQLRDLDDLVYKCDASNKTHLAFGKLKNNPLDYMPIHEIKNMFKNIYEHYEGRRYDMNVYSLLSSIVTCLRPARRTVTQLCQTSDWVFCSELVALVYKHFGIYPDYVNPRDVLPRDIAFPQADTDNMPVILSDLTRITTPVHYEY